MKKTFIFVRATFREKSSLIQSVQMVRLLSITGILLLFVSPCMAQNKQPRSTHELQLLISKSGNDTTHISLLLEAGLQCANKPGALKTDLDSAAYFTSQALQLSRALKSAKWEGKCMIVYSVLYRERNDAQHGKNYVQNAINIFSKSGDKTDLGNAYLELANYYRDSSETEAPEKIKLTKLAGELFGQAGEWELKANTLITLDVLYESTYDHTNAMSVLHQALDIYEKIHYPKMQDVYDPLSCVSHEMGKLDDALKYGMMAAKAAEAQKDSSAEMAQIYNEVAVTYLDQGQMPQAIEYYQKALIFSEKNNDTSRTANLIVGLVHSYHESGEPTIAINFLKSAAKKYTFSRPADRAKILGSFLNCYLRMNEYNLAKPYLNELVSISGKYPITDEIQNETFGKIISYYLATKEYKNADRYCSYNEILLKKINNPYNLAVNYHRWYCADTGLGNCAAALLHYRMFAIMKDSILQESYTKHMAEQQTRFETEKKEKDIQMLTQKNQIQQTQLKQTKLTKNVVLGGTTMLALLLGLGYNRYRLKQRSNKQLEIQRNEINKKNEFLQQLLKEKEWLIKEIHHRVKNNLQIVMSLLNTQSSYLDNTEAVKAISESQHRMHAMSLIHQKLYQSENVATVKMEQYISELIGYLSESYDAGARIHFSRDIDDIKLDVAQAIPIGLILNEAVTNSIKYAFPGNNSGHVNISLKRTSGNNLTLNIADNGVGLPGNYDINKSSSLGINLIKGLANQLEGSFIIKNDNGLGIEIKFPYVMAVENSFEVLSGNNNKT